ncbi:hypothetical protein ACJYYY_04080 [Brochothrix campestris]|uniref:hypothetical protein n=1 Tax=Brochothrix campestris TaxID=2757 RepID=UPI0038D1ED58
MNLFLLVYKLIITAFGLTLMMLYPGKKATLVFIMIVVCYFAIETYYRHSKKKT